FDGICLNHVIVLLPDPALAADVGAGQQALQVVRKITWSSQLIAVGHFTRNRRLPSFQWTLVYRCIVGEGFIRDLCDHLPMREHTHGVLADHSADLDCIEPPLLEHAEHFIFAALLRDQQHALLRFAQHEFVSGHSGFALGNAIHFDFQTYPPTGSHFAGRTCKPGSAHILNANYGAGLHGFKARFKQKFLQKRVAHLYVGALRLSLFAELFAGHGRAVNAVTPSLGSNVDHRIAFACGPGVENLIFADQAERECVHQWIARIAGLEFGFAAEVGYTEAVAVGRDAAHDAFKDRMITMYRRRGRDSRLRLSSRAKLGSDRPESQRIHYRHRTRAHGKDVAQNAPDASGRALKRLNE